MRINSSAALLTMFMAASALGCASAGTPQETDRRIRMSGHTSETTLDVNVHDTQSASSQDVPITVVKAFDALTPAYVKLGIKDAAVVDNTGGTYTIGASNIRVHGSLAGTRMSAYIDCGSAPMYDPANAYDINFSATTYVTANNAGGATLHTLILAQATDPTANTPPVHCTSTGGFEKKLAQLVLAGQ
jgi:hypothetical protein